MLRRRDGARGAHGARLPRAAGRALHASPDGLVDVPDGGVQYAGAGAVRLAARGGGLLADASASFAPCAAAAAEEKARVTKPDWLAKRYRESEERPVRFSTVSDMEVEPLYTAERRRRRRTASGSPASIPYTRGVYPSMYRGRLWTMRQFAGFGTAEDTNARFQLPARAGADGPLDRLRHADAHGLRRRPPARPRRGRPRGRRRLDARRHGARSSTASASTEVTTSMTVNCTASVAPRHVPRRRRASRACRGRSSAARSRTTC